MGPGKIGRVSKEDPLCRVAETRRRAPAVTSLP